MLNYDFFNYSQQDATIFDYLFLKGSTCFGRFLRPSSGAHNCTFSLRYCQLILLQAGIVDEKELQLHLIHDTSLQQYWLTVPGAECTVMYSWWWAEEPPETCRAFYHHISVMELGHLLTRSGLTYPEFYSKVYHDSSCQLGSSVSLPLGNLFRDILFTCCIQPLLYSSNLSKIGFIF